MTDHRRSVEAGRVRPLVGVRVRERHVAAAEAVERAQRVERVLDGVTALDAHEDRDLALALGAADVGGRRGEQQVAGVTLDLPVRDVDEIHGAPQRTTALHRRLLGQLALDVDGEELGRDPAGLHAREIGVGARRARTEIVVAREDHRGDVVVAVDDDGLAMQARRALLDGLAGPRSIRGGARARRRRARGRPRHRSARLCRRRVELAAALRAARGRRDSAACPAGRPQRDRHDHGADASAQASGALRNAVHVTSDGVLHGRGCYTRAHGAGGSLDRHGHRPWRSEG